MAADAEEPTSEQPPCSPCRGTGRVISNLGGTAHEQPCPWCEGTGRFIPGHDAQAAQPGEGAERGTGEGADAPESGGREADELPIKSDPDSAE